MIGEQVGRKGLAKKVNPFKESLDIRDKSERERKQLQHVLWYRQPPALRPSAPRPAAPAKLGRQQSQNLGEAAVLGHLSRGPDLATSAPLAHRN